MKRSSGSAISYWAAVTCALIGVALASSPAAWAVTSEWAEGHKTKARLVAGRSTPSDGSRLLAFVEIELAPGWKTYWRSPGDAGLPPSFDWSKSTNVAQAEVQFPAPSHFTDKSGHTIGYERRLFLPVLLTPKAAGEPMTLAVDAHYGICNEICVPVDAELKLDVAADTATLAPAAALIALDRVPRPQDKLLPGDPALIRAESNASKIVVEARFPDAESGAVFLEATDGVFLPIPTEAGAGSGGSKVFEAELPAHTDAAALKGKTVTVTLVSEAGASYGTFVVP